MATRRLRPDNFIQWTMDMSQRFQYFAPVTMNMHTLGTSKMTCMKSLANDLTYLYPLQAQYELT